MPRGLINTGQVPQWWSGVNTMRLAGSIIATIASSGLLAGTVEISMDGQFEDWSQVPVAWDDPVGDAPGAIDLTRIWIANDERFVFLRLEATGDFDLSENNDLRIYLDTDSNPATGLAVGGLGAELEWRTGERMGSFFHDGDVTDVYHDAIRFRGLPTVTSNQFEMSFGRDTLPDGQHPLFVGEEIRVLVMDGTTGDQAPDDGKLLEFTMDPDPGPGPTTLSLDRLNPANLRMITHNVKTDRITDPDYQDSFMRLYSAVNPDILHLQEIYDSSPAQIEQLVQDWLGGTWYSAGVNDCKTISRYPVIDSWAIDLNLAVLLDTTDVLGTEMLCINAHLPCCSNDEGRQDEIDAIMAFIREAYLPGSGLFLGPEVPVLIAGDLNLVGWAQQLDTLLTGDIQDEDTHGPDQEPDPDGSDLANVISRQTEKRMGYTWRNDYSSFWPGHLDFLIYSDSNMERRHDFIVYTPEMSPTELANHGLESQDSVASDHLVFCVEFAPPCSSDVTGDGQVDVNDLLQLLAAWGTTDPQADVNGDGIVDADDLLAILADWGACSE